VIFDLWSVFPVAKQTKQTKKLSHGKYGTFKPNNVYNKAKTSILVWQCGRAHKMASATKVIKLILEKCEIDNKLATKYKTHSMDLSAP